MGQVWRLLWRYDSGAVIVAENDGEVISADATRIVVRNNVKKSRNKETKGSDYLDSAVSIYTLAKHQRSNQNTCVNQKPLVVSGQKIKEGEVIADGPSTEQGSLLWGAMFLSRLCLGMGTTSRMR